jgi:predicted nucleic acid-binding protein
MPPQPLPRIPNGSNLFIDTNIFVYGIGGKSPECLALLERCSREELTGICSYVVILDATHQFMIAEAIAGNQIPPAQRNAAKFLKEHPAIVSAMRGYWTNTERMFSLNLLFLETEESVMRQAQIERQNAGLLTVDSTIVACMREYGILLLATADRDFERVNGIQVYSPTDL